MTTEDQPPAEFVTFNTRLDQYTEGVLLFNDERKDATDLAFQVFINPGHAIPVGPGQQVRGVNFGSRPPLTGDRTPAAPPP